MLRISKNHKSLGFAGALFCAAVACADHPPLYLSGDPAPDGDGTLIGFFYSALNNAGVVAFRGFLTGTANNEGVFKGSGGELTQIARRNTSPPDGNGVFSSFADPALNNAGQAAFWAFIGGAAGGANEGVFLGDGDTGEGGLIEIARRGEAAPDGNGTLNTLGTPYLNSEGQAAFRATVTGASGGADQGIFRGDGGTLVQIARRGQEAPDGNGILDQIFFPALNDAGQAAFRASLSGTDGGTTDNDGIFRGDGGALTQIARRGQAAPDGDGTLNFFFIPSINNAGQVAFRGGLGLTTFVGEDGGIFVGDGGALIQVARQGDAAPDGNGTMFHFSFPLINDAGQVAFFATLAGTTGGATDGIFRWDGGEELIQLYRRGQAVPDGNGTIDGPIVDPAFNNGGQIAFYAALEGTKGEDEDEAIFLSDGIDLIQAVRKGDLIDGMPVTEMLFNDSAGGNSPHRTNFNDFGQVAYVADLAWGEANAIGLFTPELHWRVTSSGDFDDGANWTLSLSPGEPHDVFFNPDSSVTATVAAGLQTVRSLQVGGGEGTATLSLESEATIAMAEDYAQGSAGTLQIELAEATADPVQSGLVVGGNATIDGELIVSLLDGFIPDASDTFTILAAGGSLNGTFANAQTTIQTTGGGTFDVSYDDNMVVLSNFVPAVLGDLNGDGVVGVPDLLILLAAWGRCSDCNDCPADLTGNCNVGVADLLVLLANWG